MYEQTSQNECTDNGINECLPYQPAKHEEQFSSWPTGIEIRQPWLESASATCWFLEFEQLL